MFEMILAVRNGRTERQGRISYDFILVIGIHSENLSYALLPHDKKNAVNMILFHRKSQAFPVVSRGCASLDPYRMTKKLLQSRNLVLWIGRAHVSEQLHAPTAR